VRSVMDAIADVDELVDVLTRRDAGDDGEDLPLLAHHLQTAAQLASSAPDDLELQIAGLVHDIGSIVEGTETQTKTAYHIVVWTHQNKGASGNVLHIVDGKLQKRNLLNRSNKEGQYFDSGDYSAADWTRLLIAKFDWSSTDVFYKFRLKHLAVTAAPLTTEQLKKSIKFLSNKYGITLTDGYYK
jgi:predicted HD phosphohydrolase